MDLYEALYTTRAMRRVRPDPVPEAVVKLMLDAAIRAPSGGNTQQWRFMPVTARETVGALGDLYRDAYAQLHQTIYKGQRDKVAAEGDETSMRVFSSSDWLGENFGSVPLVVLVFSRNDPDGSSIYPAIWNNDARCPPAKEWGQPSQLCSATSSMTKCLSCWVYLLTRAGALPPR